MKTSPRWSRVVVFWLAATSAFHLPALALFGQSAVQFNNTAQTQLTTNTPSNPFGGPTQAGYTIGLYVAPQGTTDPYAFVLMGPTTASQSGPFGQGRFNGNPLPNNFVISNNTGQPIAFQVRAWSTSAGPTYETAASSGLAYRGVSAIGQVTPATNLQSPPALFGTSAGQVGGFTLTTGGYAGPPTVSITAPTDGSLFSAPALVLVTASADQIDNNVASVTLVTNGVVAAQTTGFYLSFYLSNLTAGHYTLRARALGGNGVSGTSAPVTIRVASRPVLDFARGSNGPIQFQFDSATGINYVVERGTLTNFSPVITNPGTASPISYSETNSSATQRTYRVRLE